MYSDDINDETIELYRQVFSSPRGRKVFAHMVTELGLFDEVEPNDIGAVTLQNYAKHLCYRCGIYRGEIVDEIIKNLFKIPWFKKE